MSANLFLSSPMFLHWWPNFPEETRAIVLTSLLAGGAIGFGARIASGCTSGHGISGTALGSPASFVSCATFMGVAVATAHAIAWLSGGA